MLGDKRLKIGILLGDARLDTLRRARVLAKALLAARPIMRQVGHVAIGLPVGDEQLWRRNAAWLADAADAVTVRRLSWERVLAGNAKRMFAAHPLPVATQAIDRVTLPRDWGSNFLDCDMWMVVAGPEIGGVYPVRPTAIFCSDLAARRVPGAYAAAICAPYWQDQITAFRLWRQSTAVIASDPLTAGDLLDYAGVAPDRIVTLSQPLDLPARNPAKPAHPDVRELLIRIEPDMLHAVDSAILALRRYLAEGGTLHPIFATEAPPDAFGPSSNIPQIAFLSGQARSMLKDIPVEQIVSHERWERLLDQAAAVWMTREAGCDGASLRQALRSGKPVLAPAGPQADHALGLAGGAMVQYGTLTVDDRVEGLHRLEAMLAKRRPATATIDPDGAVLSREIGFVVDRLEETSHG